MRSFQTIVGFGVWITDLDSGIPGTVQCTATCDGPQPARRRFAGDNGFPYPHGKGASYGPGLNVPFIVQWPHQIKTGTVCDNLISGAASLGFG